jgi:antitoxin (DNA-binding transcriptional repressor) of toxin-antitoxin stability system
MLRLNTHEAKTHLSRYLSLVEAGETIILCRRNEPIAEIRPIRPPTSPGIKRVFGVDEGKFNLTDDFFAPLPNSVIEAFNGESGEGVD